MNIKSFNPKHPVTQLIKQKLHKLILHGHQISLCWSPSHVGIPGNECADKKAKEAAQDQGESHLRVYHRDCKALFRCCVREWYQEYWSQHDNNKLFQIKPMIAHWPSAFLRSRRHEVALSRLRIGHTNITHKYLMEQVPPPVCDLCGCTVTVYHLLIECRKFSRIRSKYLGSSPDLKTILEDNEVSFFETKLFPFLHDTGLIELL